MPINFSLYDILDFQWRSSLIDFMQRLRIMSMQFLQKAPFSCRHHLEKYWGDRTSERCRRENGAKIGEKIGTTLKSNLRPHTLRRHTSNHYTNGRARNTYSLPWCNVPLCEIRNVCCFSRRNKTRFVEKSISTTAPLAWKWRMTRGVSESMKITLSSASMTNLNIW